LQGIKRENKMSVLDGRTMQASNHPTTQKEKQNGNCLRGSKNL